MGNRLLVLRHCPEVCWKPATPPGEKVQRHGIDMDTVDSDAESEVRVATKVTSPDPPQSDWVQLQDLATNKPYYFNRITKETTWQMPREFAHAVQKAQKSKENQGDWVEAQTKDGRVYWYDRVSRQTSWGKPAALVALTRRSTKFARKKMSRRKKASSQLPLEVVTKTDSKPAIKLTNNNSPRVQLLNTTVETLSQEEPDGNAERSAAPVSPSKSSSSQGTLTELDLEECMEDCDTNNEYSEKCSTGSITPPFSSLTTLSNVEHKTSDENSNEEMKEVVVSHEDNKVGPRETIEIEKNDAVKQTQEEESKEEDAVEAKGKRTRKKKKNKKKSAGMENTTQHGTELATT